MTTSTAETRKLYQQVANAIAESIREGQYLPGQRLPSERDLAEDYKVSRPTVREAMIALEIRGLVEARHGSGVYVTDKPQAEIAPPELDIGAFELTEARRLIEGESCALAATTITDAELVQLAAIMDDMVVENDRDVKGDLADRRFHVAIAQATRNSALVTVVENLWDLRYKSPLCRVMLERARQVGVRPLIDDHQEILLALKARDPKASRNAMREHLGRVIDNLLTATEIDALEQARSEVEARRTELVRRSRV
jgi:GntR family transcriptional repressor for pyruvate dehydrogenase complex